MLTAKELRRQELEQAFGSYNFVVIRNGASNYHRFCDDGDVHGLDDR